MIDDKLLRGNGCVSLLLWMLLTAGAQAQPMADHPTARLWRQPQLPPQVRAPSGIWINPLQFRELVLDHAGMREFLARSPHERVTPVTQSDFVVALPMPDGSFQGFRIVVHPRGQPQFVSGNPPK